MEAPLKTVSNQRLLLGLDELVAKGHRNEADLLAYLAEVDKRRLYLEQGCTSMYHYCTEVLHFAEGMAFHRIAAARAARAFPLLRRTFRQDR